MKILQIWSDSWWILAREKILALNLARSAEQEKSLDLESKWILTAEKESRP